MTTHDQAIGLTELLGTLDATGWCVLVAVGSLLLGKLLGRKGRSAVRRSAGRVLRKVGRWAVKRMRVGLWALRLRMPLRLALRLQSDRWRSMCEARKLSGLRRLKVTRTKSGVAVRVGLGGALDLASLASRLDQLETGLGVERKTLRLEPLPRADRALVHVQLRDPLAKPVKWPGHPSADVRQPTSLGMFPSGEWDPVDIRARYVIAGRSGAGKSVLLRVLCAAVVTSANARLTYLDLKRVEATSWERVADIAVTPEQVRSAVAGFKARMEARLERMAAAGLADHVPTADDPDEYLVVDEFAELVRADMPDVLAMLESIAQLGRAAGMWLWSCSQEAVGRAIPTAIATQADAVIGLRLANKRVSDTLFGAGSAREGWRSDRLKGKGWYLLRDMDHDEPQPARACYLSTSDVKALKAPSSPVPAPVEALVPAVPPRPAYAPSVAPVLTLVKSEVPTSPTDPGDLVVSALVSAGGPVATTALVEASGLPRSSAYELIKELVKDGRMAKLSHGRYGLPTESAGEASA